MGSLAYYLFLPFIYGIALLPFPLLYLFSDLIYFILFVVFGYRHHIIHQNLVKSFPEKSKEEIKSLEKEFEDIKRAKYREQARK